MMPANRTIAPARGFTLLELAVVIAVITVLAAVLLSRLVGIQGDARIAKARMIHGSLHSAALLAHWRCELDLAAGAPALSAANCRANPPRVDMGGRAVEIVNRYPAATVDGILAAANIDPAAANVLTGGAGCPPGALCLDIVGGTAPNCRVTYRPAAHGAPAPAAPLISVETSGC